MAKTPHGVPAPARAAFGNGILPFVFTGSRDRVNMALRPPFTRTFFSWKIIHPRWQEPGGQALILRDTSGNNQSHQKDG